MRGLAIIAALALAGCDAAPDGYEYERDQFKRDEVTVSVVTYQNVDALREAARQFGVSAGDGRELHAFGMVNQTGPTCTIHIVEPSRSYQPEWVGHEFVHCIRGQWHH